jgi:DNA-binding MarR family transcriptional regulator
LSDNESKKDVKIENPSSDAEQEKEGDLAELASAGPLSNLTRVGIMLALLGVERITFSELLMAVKVSKSSLSRSLEILQESGLVKIRRGFGAFGGPRTFIQITDSGKTAIRTHLETMRRVTQKYLKEANEVEKTG